MSSPQSASKDNTGAYPHSCPRHKSTHLAGIGHRLFCYFGDWDGMCFRFALCGLWSNSMLHILLVVAESHLDSPNTLCWSLGALIWSIIALATHYLSHVNQLLKSKKWESSYAPLLEVSILLIITTAYRETILLSPRYKELFSTCLQSESNYIGRSFTWYTSISLVQAISTMSQCDTARAILYASWIGPVGLLLVTWALFFATLARSSSEEALCLPEPKLSEESHWA